MAPPLTNGSLKSSEQAIQAMSAENLRLKLELLSVNEKLETSEKNFMELFIKNHKLTKELQDLKKRKLSGKSIVETKDSFESRKTEGDSDLDHDDENQTAAKRIMSMSPPPPPPQPAKETKDTGTMTDLDRLNVEKLIWASIQLRRLQEEEQRRPPQPPPVQRQQSQDIQHQSDHRHHQNDNQQFRQQTVRREASKPMMPDEKTILEELFRTNGLLMAARDILRAKEPSFLS